MEKYTKIFLISSSIIKNIRNFISSASSRITHNIESRPLLSFFGLLLLLLVVIAIGNTMRKPKITEEEAKKPNKQVSLFSIGKAPKITFSGKVEKSGVIKIVAQSPGIVQMINRTEGSTVSRGTVLFGLSSNYQGGNIASLSRELAQKSLTLTEENYPIQKEMIEKRREIANKADTTADDFRNITHDSIQSTKDLIKLNEDILSSINSNLTTLESTNVGGVNDQVILQTKQAKSGVLSALNGLQTGLRNAEYTSSDGTAQAKLSDLGKELTLKQLDVEKKALDLGKEIAQINLKIAQISESFMYPAAPGKGVIERIHVHVGDAVNPGQLLASMVCEKNLAHVVVSVSSDMAAQISRLENSTLMVDGREINMTPRYISQEPTNGNLHTVIFTLPEDVGEKVSDGSSIPVQMPIGNAQSTASVPYIPIDAVFQTQTSSIVFTATQSAEGVWMAQGTDITLGEVFGSYVEVKQGLSASDQIIMNRNIIAGDTVTF